MYRPFKKLRLRMVEIDTLSKIRPKAKAYENAYDADYEFVGRLKDFADSRGICVLLVHHAQALCAAVEYLQRSHQHLKDQIYTSTPAGSPESTQPQNDPQGVPV